MSSGGVCDDGGPSGRWAVLGGSGCATTVLTGCANTGFCAITASAYVRGGISVAVDCCSVGDVCGCSAVLGPAEVPGASGACCG